MGRPQIQNAVAGRPTESSNRASTTDSAPVPTVPHVVIPASSRGPSRGVSQAHASPDQLPKSPAASVLRAGIKKAVAIGLNYNKYGKKDIRLTRSNEDARRFADTLTKQGYSSQNIRVVTDEENQPLPSSEYLIRCMDWLVQDASKGDQLFFAFSGHCEPPKIGQSEPHLIAADMMAIPRSTFHEHLVSKVPAGAELTIVLDCCNAAGMVQLKYCVGKMDYEREVTKMMGPVPPAESGKPAPAIRTIPQHGSLHGLPVFGQKAPTQMTPAMAKTAPSGARQNILLHRGGVAAGQSLSMGAPNQAPAPGMISSLMGRALGTTSSSLPAKPPVGTKVKVGRNLVVEGVPLPHFEAREKDYVTPAGKVTVWAGAGQRQKSYEPSTGGKNSIVTDVYKSLSTGCNATQRDLWHSVVGAVDKENSLRSGRDKHKDITKLATNTRWQCAEVWVSQVESLSSSSPILDQPVF
ncbi:caspase domain-containing protein [Rhizoctonia solani]|nr:caspase domain-containing protein [Rhizoctonia solani]